MIHLLVGKLGSCEAIIVIILGYQKVTVLLFLHYRFMNHCTVNKYEFLIFLFVRSNVNNT